MNELTTKTKYAYVTQSEFDGYEKGAKEAVRESVSQAVNCAMQDQKNLVKKAVRTLTATGCDRYRIHHRLDLRASKIWKINK